MANMWKRTPQDRAVVHGRRPDAEPDLFEIRGVADQGDRAGIHNGGDARLELRFDGLFVINRERSFTLLMRLAGIASDSVLVLARPSHRACAGSLLLCVGPFITARRYS